MKDKNGEEVYENPEWYARAELDDGTVIEHTYPYVERTYVAECRRQAEIEAELIDEASKYGRDGFFYSVGVREKLE